MQPATTSPSSGDPAGASSASSSSLRETQVRSAVLFLTNPKVKSSPALTKVKFLEKKGVTAAEIAEAFKRVDADSSEAKLLAKGVLEEGKSASEALASSSSSSSSSSTSVAVPVPAPTPADPNAPMMQQLLVQLQQLQQAQLQQQQAALQRPPPPPPLTGWDYARRIAGVTLVVSGVAGLAVALKRYFAGEPIFSSSPSPKRIKHTSPTASSRSASPSPTSSPATSPPASPRTRRRNRRAQKQKRKKDKEMSSGSSSRRLSKRTPKNPKLARPSSRASNAGADSSDMEAFMQEMRTRVSDLTDQVRAQARMTQTALDTVKKTKTELTSEITALKALQRTSAGSGSSNSTSRYGYGYGRAPAAISPAHSQTSLEPPVEEIVSEPFDLEASKAKVRAAVGQLLADTSNTKTCSSVNFYLGKIIDEPSAPQFRRINLTNRAVQREGVQDFLLLCGFEVNMQRTYIEWTPPGVPDDADEADFLTSHPRFELLRFARDELSRALEEAKPPAYLRQQSAPVPSYLRTGSPSASLPVGAALTPTGTGAATATPKRADPPPTPIAPTPVREPSNDAAES